MANKIKLDNDYPDVFKSLKLLERSRGLIPANTQTLAKGPTQYVQGVSPVYLYYGKGSHVWDIDDNEYIDFNMGIGPLVLGYSIDEIDKAILKQLKKGITFSLVHPLEVEVAEKVTDMVPNAESVRFSKAGCDVTTAAVRLARAFTGRNKILCCGYHGWHDWYIGVTDRNLGIPEEIQNMTYTFNYNDIESLRNSLSDDVAAVILEPVIFEKPENNFLQEVEKLTKENGSLLIFDEMWTGFRIAQGGAQEYFNIKADLASFSKAIANGMPLSVLAGRRDIMNLFEKDVFFFTTFGGETLSLAAASATMDFIQENDVIENIFAKGERLMKELKQILVNKNMNYVNCSGYPFRTIVTFNPEAGNPLEMKSLLQQEMIRLGILWGGFHNMSYSHSDEDINYTLEAYDKALDILKSAVENNKVKEMLKGTPVEPVFRKTTNFRNSNK